MNDEQHKRVVDALVDYVVRVSKGGVDVSSSEATVLPAVAKVLAEM